MARLIIIWALCSGCAGFSLKDAALTLGGSACVDVQAGWDGDPVFSVEIKACIDSASIDLGALFDYQAALDLCVEASHGEK